MSFERERTFVARKKTLEKTTKVPIKSGSLNLACTVILFFLASLRIGLMMDELSGGLPTSRLLLRLITTLIDS